MGITNKLLLGLDMVLVLLPVFRRVGSGTRPDDMEREVSKTKILKDGNFMECGLLFDLYILLFIMRNCVGLFMIYGNDFNIICLYRKNVSYKTSI